MLVMLKLKLYAIAVKQLAETAVSLA